MSLFGIPIVVRPVFWLFAGVLGFYSSGTLIGMAIWMGIIFISVLFHELGHGLAALFYKKTPRIELVALGGVTYYEGERLGLGKQFLITLSGPLFGFMLYGICIAFLFVPSVQGKSIELVLQQCAFVNLLWSVLNLLPVFPLDGGQLLRIVLEAIFGYKGIRYAQVVGMILAGLISLISFVISAFFLGALFFLLGFQCYDVWRKTKLFSEEDANDSTKGLLEKAEKEMQMGREESAEEILEEIRKKGHRGVIYLLATQYLGILYAKKGENTKAYALLLPLRKQLPIGELCLLHKLAFEEKDYPVVVELSGSCYQYLADPEIALRNAYACGFLAQAKAAAGWLSAAVRSGMQNIEEVVKEKAFDPVREEEAFQDFLRNHS